MLAAPDKRRRFAEDHRAAHFGQTDVHVLGETSDGDLGRGRTLPIYDAVSIRKLDREGAGSTRIAAVARRVQKITESEKLANAARKEYVGSRAGPNGDFFSDRKSSWNVGCPAGPEGFAATRLPRYHMLSLQNKGYHQFSYSFSHSVIVSAKRSVPKAFSSSKDFPREMKHATTKNHYAHLWSNGKMYLAADKVDKHTGRRLLLERVERSRKLLQREKKNKKKEKEKEKKKKKMMMMRMIMKEKKGETEKQKQKKKKKKKKKKKINIKN
eukprot:g4209.t1